MPGQAQSSFARPMLLLRPMFPSSAAPLHHGIGIRLISGLIPPVAITVIGIGHGGATPGTTITPTIGGWHTAPPTLRPTAGLPGAIGGRRATAQTPAPIGGIAGPISATETTGPVAGPPSMEIGGTNGWATLPAINSGFLAAAITRSMS